MAIFLVLISLAILFIIAAVALYLKNPSEKIQELIINRILIFALLLLSAAIVRTNISIDKVVNLIQTLSNWQY